MQRPALVVVVLTLFLVLSGCTNESAVRSRREAARRNLDSVATEIKRDVIEMKKAGIGDDVTINYLQTTGSFFPLNRYDIVELADSGVSDSVINAMIVGFNERPKSAAYLRWGYSWPYSYGWGWGNPYWYFWDPFYYYGYSIGYRAPLYWSRPHWSGGYVGHGGGQAPHGGRAGSGRRR
jgi:hypothetical protein